MDYCHVCKGKCKCWLEMPEVISCACVNLQKENEELKKKIEKQKEVLSDLHIDTRYIGESMTKVSIRFDELLKDSK